MRTTTDGIAPGPDIKGIDSGKTVISSFMAASADSSSLVDLIPPEFLATTISIAASKSKNPPVIRKAGSEIPKTSKSQSPKNAKLNKIRHEITDALRAILLRCKVVSFGVKAKNTWTTAKGSTITKSVTKAWDKNSNMF